MGVLMAGQIFEGVGMAAASAAGGAPNYVGAQKTLETYDNPSLADGTADLRAGELLNADLAQQQVETRADLTQQVADVRANLPADLQGVGNIGVAEINVPGVQSTMIGFSRISAPSAEQQEQGFVGQVANPTFSSTVVPNAEGYSVDRAGDSEAVILNNVAAQVGNNTSATGAITLLTELAPCSSCSNVITQFQNMYPNITLNVINNGGRIAPASQPQVP
jgi:filamentous hemagglutinin